MEGLLKKRGDREPRNRQVLVGIASRFNVVMKVSAAALFQGQPARLTGAVSQHAAYKVRRPLLCIDPAFQPGHAGNREQQYNSLCSIPCASISTWTLTASPRRMNPRPDFASPCSMA